jgi:hypothetical protein
MFRQICETVVWMRQFIMVGGVLFWEGDARKAGVIACGIGNAIVVFVVWTHTCSLCLDQGVVVVVVARWNGTVIVLDVNLQ